MRLPNCERHNVILLLLLHLPPPLLLMLLPPATSVATATATCTRVLLLCARLPGRMRRFTTHRSGVISRQSTYSASLATGAKAPSPHLRQRAQRHRHRYRGYAASIRIHLRGDGGQVHLPHAIVWCRIGVGLWHRADPVVPHVVEAQIGLRKHATC